MLPVSPFFFCCFGLCAHRVCFLWLFYIILGGAGPPCLGHGIPGSLAGLARRLELLHVPGVQLTVSGDALNHAHVRILGFGI